MVKFLTPFFSKKYTIWPISGAALVFQIRSCKLPGRKVFMWEFSFEGEQNTFFMNVEQNHNMRKGFMREELTLAHTFFWFPRRGKTIWIFGILRISTKLGWDAQSVASVQNLGILQIWNESQEWGNAIKINFDYFQIEK